MVVGMAFHRLITVLSVGVFLINIIGPIVDHHFVERGHDHDHLYLGIASPDHIHLYDSKHRHESQAYNISGTQSDAGEHIVFITKDDGMRSAGAYVNADLTLEPKARYGSVCLILRSVSDCRIPLGDVITPVTHPPIF